MYICKRGVISATANVQKTLAVILQYTSGNRSLSPHTAHWEHLKAQLDGPPSRFPSWISMFLHTSPLLWRKRYKIKTPEVGAKASAHKALTLTFQCPSKLLVEMGYRGRRDFCPASLIWSRSLFLTALSGSHLYCLPSCPHESCNLWNRKGSAACGTEQIVHGSSLSLWHEGEKKRRRTKLGEIALQGRRKKNVMKTSVSSLHIISQKPILLQGESLLWSLTEPNKFLIR